MKKKRADVLLTEQNLAKNKNEAAAYIMAGKVFTKKELKVLTAGEHFPENTEFYIKGQEKKYVSRGGLKLEKALSFFDLSLKDQVVLDIGASTGGFTDVALQKGAKLVYALDVGTNQLVWKLRSHEQVVVMEQMNFRYSKPSDFKQGLPTFASIDVSFISLSLIFPPLKEILKEEGEVVALIKPQFEAEREEVETGGIVSDSLVYQKVLKRVIKKAQEENFVLQNLTLSPIKGSKGNIEFLGYFIKNGHNEVDTEKMIAEVLKEVNKNIS